jgi:ATP-dependent Zn protease
MASVSGWNDSFMTIPPMNFCIDGGGLNRFVISDTDGYDSDEPDIKIKHVPKEISPTSASASASATTHAVPSFISHSKQFTVYISDENNRYDEILEKITQLYIEQYGSEISELHLDSDNFRINKSQKNKYHIPHDKYIIIIFKDNPIKCILYNKTEYYGGQNCVVYIMELMLTSETKEIMDDFLLWTRFRGEKLSVFHYNVQGGGWMEYEQIHKRDESTIIMKKEDKDKLLADVDDFVSPSTEADYIKYGIMYKRNYLFYGKPGTGKTSLCNILATRLKRNIYIMTFDAKMQDSDLLRAINMLNGKKSILLYEDVDCIFQDRTTNMNGSNVTFSGLLNALDGVTKVKGLISIVTSNYVKQLDSAFLRPGRIDMMLKFDIISREQILGLLDLFNYSKIDKEVVDELCDFSVKHDLVPATFSGFMFRHRKHGLDSSNYIKLFEKYLQEIDPAIAHKDQSSYT